jgi:O-antigen/teichoic acid export membrane protein
MNFLVIAIASRYLFPDDFAKLLATNLLLNLSIIFEAGAGPIFSKAFKNNLSEALNNLNTRFQRRAIAFLTAATLILILLSFTLGQIGIASVLVQINALDWCLICFMSYLKISCAPSRGVILGAEKFNYILILQIIEFSTKLVGVGLLLFLEFLSFTNFLIVFTVSYLILLASANIARFRCIKGLKINADQSNESRLLAEFKDITIGTSIWVIFSNLDKLLLSVAASANFFAIYSVASTIGTFQNNLFGPYIPVVGQRMLRRDLSKTDIALSITQLFLVGLVVLSVFLLVLNFFGFTLISIWLGVDVNQITKIVEIAFWLSFIPLCTAVNGLAFHFQFAFNDLLVYRFMNIISPFSNTVILLYCIIGSDLKSLPLYLAMTHVVCTALNFLWISARFEKY